MGRFLLIAFILILIISLAGALTGNVLLYGFHQQKQTHLDSRATRIAGLEEANLLGRVVHRRVAILTGQGRGDLSSALVWNIFHVKAVCGV